MCTDHGSTVSSPKISKSADRAMDKSSSKARALPPGVSIRHGPVTEDKMDVDGMTNGVSKRKSRSSISNSVNYKDGSDSDDGTPLVGSRDPTSPRWFWAFADVSFRPNAPKRLISVLWIVMTSQ